MRWYGWCCVLMGFLLARPALAQKPVEHYARQWQQVEALRKEADRTSNDAKRQQKTAAIDVMAEALWQQARAHRQPWDFLRALMEYERRPWNRPSVAPPSGYRFKGWQPEEFTQQLEADVQQMPFPARPVIRALLARNYLKSLEHRRYSRALYSSWTKEELALEEQIDQKQERAAMHHYQQMMLDEPLQQQALTVRNAPILQPMIGGFPSLYDALAHAATQGLRRLYVPGNDGSAWFQPADPRRFADSEVFGRLSLPTPTDSFASYYHTLWVWQQLTAARLTTAAQRPILADIELRRLQYAYPSSSHPHADSLYLAALRRGARTYAAYPVSTEYLAALAQELERDQPAQAVRVCREAERRFPQSLGARQCAAIRHLIEQPKLSVDLNTETAPQLPWVMQVTHRNVARLYAWAYRVPVRHRYIGANEYDQDLYSVYNWVQHQTPAAAWEVPLPADTVQYQAQQQRLLGPALASGRYLLVFRTTKEVDTLAERPAPVCLLDLNVSDLALLRRSVPSKGETALWLLHRRQGTAYAGAQVHAAFRQEIQHEYRREQRNSFGPALVPDAQGRLAFTPAMLEAGAQFADAQFAGVLCTAGSDSLLVHLEPPSAPYPSTDTPPMAREAWSLFTDRAAYQPGETVQLKGILMRHGPDSLRTLAGRLDTVRLFGSNNETLAALPVTTNSFGSVQAAIPLPDTLRSGTTVGLSLRNERVQLTIQPDRRASLRIHFQDQPGIAHLGQLVTVRGRVTYPDGRPAGPRTVRYRVVRQLEWPSNAYTRVSFWEYPRNETRLAAANITTDAQGRFALTFQPQPDPQVKPDCNECRVGYRYDVTVEAFFAPGDSAVATQAVRIGPNATELVWSGPTFVDRAQRPGFRLQAQYGGPAAAARGHWRIYRLTPPAEAWTLPEYVQRAPAAEPLNEALIRWLHEQLDPQTVWTWPRTLVAEQPFDLAQADSLQLPPQLQQQELGVFMLEAVPEEQGGAGAPSQMPFVLYDPAAARIPFDEQNWFVSLHDTVRPGQAAEVVLGSTYPQNHFWVEMGTDTELLGQEQFTLAADEQRRLVVPIPPAWNGKRLWIRALAMHRNQLYQHEASVIVTTVPAPLQVQLLQPAGRQPWRVAVRNRRGQPEAAEVLADWYDARLDDVAARPAFEPLRFSWTYANPLPDWQHSSKVQQASTDAWLGDVYYPLRAAAADGLAIVRSMGWHLDDSVSIEHGKLGLVSASSTSPEELPLPAPVYQQRQRLPVAEPATRAWIPAASTNQRGVVGLRPALSEAVSPGQLVLLAHTRQGATGRLSVSTPAQTLRLRAEAPEVAPQQVWLRASVVNESVESLRGRISVQLVDQTTGAVLSSHPVVVDKVRQRVKLKPHQRQQFRWQCQLPAGFTGPLTYRFVLDAGAEQAEAQGSLADFSPVSH